MSRSDHVDLLLTTLAETLAPEASTESRTAGLRAHGDGRDSGRRAGKKLVAMERHEDHPGPDSDRTHKQDSRPEPANGRNGAERGRLA